MTRRLNDAVIAGFPTGAKPAAFLDKPTAGNLAPSESWRRMIGGRKRYNHNRQQIAEARREAILFWLMDNRMHEWCKVLREEVRVHRIVVRHGDGAMLARALRIGKTTVCRDLSALQAVHPAIFGRLNYGVPYAEYMDGWRFMRRTCIGNEEPAHNLRFPANQNGPKARSARRVARFCRQPGYPDGERQRSSQDLSSQDSPSTEADPLPSCTEDFLAILDKNCDQEVRGKPPARRQRAASAVGVV